MKAENKNRFVVTVVIGHTMDGKPIRKWFTSNVSKKDAERKAKEFRLSSEPANPVRTTFETYCNYWLETYKYGTVRGSTYRSSYEGICRKHLIPFFGRRPLASIATRDINEFFRRNRTYSESELKKCRINLNGIFETAVNEDVLAKNPVKNVQIISAQKKKPTEVWTAEQAKKAIEFSRTHPDGLGVHIMLALGLRASELLGLRWDDFDLEHKALHVSRANTKDGISETKTKGSNRWIPVPDDLIERIEDEAPQYTHGFIFQQTNNPRHPITTAYYTSHRLPRFMHDLEEATGIPPIRGHALRHTCGTVLWDSTGDLLAVSRMLGHSSVNVTEHFYVHDDVEMLRQHLFNTKKEK